MRKNCSCLNSHPHDSLAILERRKEKILIRGEKGTHSLNPRELRAFTSLLNALFVTAQEYPERMPLNSLSDSLYRAQTAAHRHLEKLYELARKERSFVIVEDHIDAGIGQLFPHAEMKEAFPVVATIYDDDGILYYTARCKNEDAVLAALDWARYDSGATYAKVEGEIFP